MRSLFGACAIMLMVFSYIEISSGMDPGQRKGKSIGRESKQLPYIIKKRDANDQVQFYNLETKTFLGLVPQELESTTVANHQHALLMQLAHNADSKPRINAPVHNNPPNTWAQGSEEHTSGLNAILDYPNYKRTHDLLAEISLKGGSEQYQRQHDLDHNAQVTTPSRRAHLKLGNQPGSSKGKQRATVPELVNLDHRRAYDMLYQPKPEKEPDSSRKKEITSIPYDKVEIVTDAIGRTRARHSKNKQFLGKDVRIVYPEQKPLADSNPGFLNQGQHDPLNQEGYPYVDTSLLGQAPVAGNYPHQFYQGQPNFWNQPGHTQHVDTQLPWQGSAAGFDPHFLNPGLQSFSHPQEDPYTNAHNLGQGSVSGNYGHNFFQGEVGQYVDPTAGMLPNSLFAKPSGPPHYPGSHGHDGSGHQQ